ncbi:syncytin-1-like [Saccopteryx leptura]|uniref:syncytin-1-like n=1 Tax=Saccopteryx leptura TaxID=249018 RepID=UPI00339C01BC
MPPTVGKDKSYPRECETIYDQMHSTCYQELQECIKGNLTVYTAILIRNREGKAPDIGTNHYMQASCRGTAGKPVCWTRELPLHISDGGGPQDAVREFRVQKKLEQILENMFPRIDYHPLTLPKGREVDLDTQTSEILLATYKALNLTNPILAADCWLCMTLGTSIPIAIPSAVNESALALVLGNRNCSGNIPFRVQPLEFFNVSCVISYPQNNSLDIDFGLADFANCSRYINSSSPLCADTGKVWLCGGNLAFSYLPVNWTGVCVLATLMPDIDIIPGDEPVPVPTLDYISGRLKRAVTLIPLLVGLGVTGAIASGMAGLGVALHSYNKLSHQLIDDIQSVSRSIQDIQDQLDFLAEMVLQNRRGLYLLTAEQGGICLALQEKCCFYVNKSGIVRDRIKKLQEDLVKRRRELFESPLWSGFNGMLPYLLPLLGPCIGFLCLISLGPIILNKLLAFVKEHIDTVKLMVLSQPYTLLPSDEESRV